MQQPPPSQPTSNLVASTINYHEVYWAATHIENPREVLVLLQNIREHLRQMARVAGEAYNAARRDLDTRRAEAYAQHRHKPSLRDPHTAKFRMVYNLRAEAVTIADTLYRLVTQGRTNEAVALWDKLADHQVLLLPWLGPFGPIDLIHLTEGTLTQQRGLLALDLPGYATMWPDWDGWHLSMEVGDTREDVPITVECAHSLITGAQFVQEVPFSNECVMPSDDTAHPTFNGLSCVLPGGSVVTTREARDDNTIDIDEPMRVALYREHYAALVWSVAAHRYAGQEEHVYAGSVTRLCFGGDGAHIPQNLVEVTFWTENLWLRRLPEEEQGQYFKPGYYLADYQPDDLFALDRFARVYTRLKQDTREEAKAARAAMQQAAQQKARQNIGPWDDGEEWYDPASELPF